MRTVNLYTDEHRAMDTHTYLTTVRKLKLYFVGTYINFFNGGNEDYFAVLDSDEIPANAKNIRKAYGRTKKAAIQIYKTNNGN